jgi:hypothetical protein
LKGDDVTRIKDNDVTRIKDNEITRIEDNEITKINDNDVTRIKDNEISKIRDDDVTRIEDNEITGIKYDDVTRIEDLANVKLSERSRKKKPAEKNPKPSEIQNLTKRKKPVKPFSKPKPEKKPEPEISLRTNTGNDPMSMTGSQASKPTQANVYMTQISPAPAPFYSSLDYRFRSSPYVSRSLTYEPAGPYTVRANFQGPLFPVNSAYSQNVSPNPNAQPKGFFYHTQVPML